MSNFNDNAIPYGARLVTVNRGSGNGSSTITNVVLENITINRSAFVIRRYNETRQPNGSVGVEDFPEGTATAQLATTSSLYIHVGDLIPFTGASQLDSNIGDEYYIVTKADQPEAQGDYKKQSISLIKRIGASGNFTVS